MIYKTVSIVSLFLLSVTANNIVQPKNTPELLVAATVSPFEAKAENIYYSLNPNQFSLPAMDSFKQALQAFYSLKDKGLLKKDILTLVDFGLSSTEKRLWVIDLSTQTVLYNTFVAHGKNSGMDFATKFSNKNESEKSSLGLYLTGETYTGKHGLSMKLDGMERGVNNNARMRSVVMHGADYVSEAVIRMQNRLGRSQGCPAIPVELTEEIISTIKDQSCLFIYHPSRARKSFGSLS